MSGVVPPAGHAVAHAEPDDIPAEQRPRHPVQGGAGPGPRHHQPRGAG